MEENIQENPVSISIKQHIVVYGKHEYILKNVQDLLTKAEFTSAGFTVLPEALDYMKMNPLDAVLIGGGVDPHDKMEIQKLVKTDLPHVKIIEHFGGPATIIPEVKSALGI
jgi:hypothetical protein